MCFRVQAIQTSHKNKLIYHDRNFRTPATASKQIGDLTAEDLHLKPESILVVHELKHAPISNLQLVVDCKMSPSTIKAPYGTVPQVSHLPVLVSVGEDNWDVSCRKGRVKGCRNCLFNKLVIQRLCYELMVIITNCLCQYEKFLSEYEI